MRFIDMKKGILFALAALCVSAVQAVTFTWNSSQGTFAGFKDANGNTVSWSGNFSITIDFSATATPNTIFQLLTADGANKAGELRFDSAGNWTENKADIGLYKGNDSGAWLKTGGDFSNTRVVSDDTTKSNKLTINFGGYNAENGVYSNISYSIIFANGQQASNTATVNWNGPATFNVDELSWTAVASGEGVTVNSLTLNADNVTTSVPEPTALALLALGVAGLALRRKA